jgi:hypothetical protein
MVQASHPPAPKGVGKPGGSLLRFFYLFFGSISLLIGCSLVLLVGYSLAIEHALPPNANLKGVLLAPVLFIGFGLYWLRRSLGVQSTSIGRHSSAVRVLEDRIWLTSAAKFAGIERELAEQSKSGTSSIYLLAHFPDVLASLSRLVADREPTIPVQVCLAKTLSTSGFGNDLHDRSANVSIIVGERHPAVSHDDAILTFAESLPCRCQIVFHLSFDDPLLKAFGGTQVQQTLRQLKMKDDEPIQSALVSRRLKAAQHKLAGTTFGDSNAPTAADWLEENKPR